MSLGLIEVGLAVSALGCGGPRPEPPDGTSANVGGSEMTGVTGIGGIFFKSDDPAMTLEWYRTHLGVEYNDWGGFPFQWRERDRPDEIGYTVWGAFPDTTAYFAPSESLFMINFRVADIEALVAALLEGGVEVVGEIEQHPNGKFAWILDPEGRKIELWEPVPSNEDPYLQDEDGDGAR
jgi:catechol 2,3-dioxygenase-like lactoylglutathione lyase family enzyme